MYSRGDLVVIIPIKKPLKPGGLYRIGKTSPAKIISVKADFYDIFSEKIDVIRFGDVFMHLQTYISTDIMGLSVIRMKLMTEKGIIGHIFFQNGRIKFIKAKK